MQLIHENVQTVKVKVAELYDDESQMEPLSCHIINALSDLPLIQPDVTMYTKSPIELENVTVTSIPFVVEENHLLIIGNNLLEKNEVKYLVTTQLVN